VSNFELLTRYFGNKGKTSNIKIAANIHKTPPNLSGIERKIA
jgi:hypothetical protein